MSPRNGQGPPDDTPGRGPPQHVRKKFDKVQRREDGTIEISDDPLEQLSQNVDWDNLSPFERWVVAVLDDNDLLDD